MKIKSSIITVVIISCLFLFSNVYAHESIDEKCVPSDTHDCTHDFIRFRFSDSDDDLKELGRLSFIVPKIVKFSAWIDGEMKTFSIDVSKDLKCLNKNEMEILRWLYKFQAMPYNERVGYRE